MNATLQRAAELLRQYGRMANTVKAYQGDETLQVAADIERMAQAEPVIAQVYEFVEKVSKQHPEKPDYWSECGQCSRNASDAEDLLEVIAAPHLPRDVLMAVAREVQRAAIQSCDEAGGDMGALHGIDLDAIVDLHAAQAAAEPASTKPVNQQLLSVLKRIVDTCNSADFDGEPSAAEMKAAEEAIAAAESAQAQQPATGGRKFFAYDEGAGFDLFDSAEEAKKEAQESIKEWRAQADDGWPDEVENVCWGVVLGVSKEIRYGDVGDGSGDCYADYVLTDIAQAQEGGAA